MCMRYAEIKNVVLNDQVCFCRPLELNCYKFDKAEMKLEISTCCLSAVLAEIRLTFVLFKE
jgi:hypothetical protein